MPGCLAPVEHRWCGAQLDLAVPKARDVLVGARTKLINHVRGTVKSFGERLPTCGAVVSCERRRELISATLRPALDPLYAALDAIAELDREHDLTIERMAKRWPDVAGASPASRGGTLTALVYLLTLDDKHRFQRGRTAAAYLGLCPRKSQSGDRDPQLRITKTGDPFLRRLLVNAANYILGPLGGDSDLRRWGLSLMARGGRKCQDASKGGGSTQARRARLPDSSAGQDWTRPCTGAAYGPAQSANGSVAARCFNVP